MTINKILSIREYAILGLNSSEPKHWEAALSDILLLCEGKHPDQLELNKQFNKGVKLKDIKLNG